MALALILSLSACGQGSEAAQTAAPSVESAGAPAPLAETDVIPEVTDQTEYVLYQNVFYGDMGQQLAGQAVTKHGIFTALQDAFNGRTRYYVWGYMDATHCCDWQWEFVPQDPSALPSPGSLVTVKGTFAAGEDALDGYWIEDAAVAVESVYAGSPAELDMCAMSCMLERVQILNVIYRAEAFEGMSFAAYGRIADINLLEDPYYNGSWQIPFSSGDPMPAIGTMVILHGVVTEGTLADCELKLEA